MTEGRDPWRRRRDIVLAGHRGDATVARDALSDPDASVRVSAVGALARSGQLTDAELSAALVDPEATVRRRAVEVAATGAARGDLTALLTDADPVVVEVAAWALGELPGPAPATVEALIALVHGPGHPDALVREAAVAALGSLGDPAGLPAILAATTDKATVRRRAVLALAAFDSPEVDEALARARTDRDWQVRQAAEDLLPEDLH